MQWPLFECYYTKQSQVNGHRVNTLLDFFPQGSIHTKKRPTKKCSFPSGWTQNDTNTIV